MIAMAGPPPMTAPGPTRLDQVALHLRVAPPPPPPLQQLQASAGPGAAVPRPGAWSSQDRTRFAELADRDGGRITGLPSPFADPAPPRPLSDAQLCSWCTAGYHVIAPDELGLPAALHEALYAKLKFALHEEHQPGNNIQARVPELSHILSSPAVTGALETLLGPGALQYPHMYCHNLEPAGSDRPSRSFNLAATGTCHQDAFSPLGRPRHHNPWHAYVCYYPGDTSEVEATHVIPASQFNNGIVPADNGRRLPLSGKAGTVFITHWDTAHAGAATVLSFHCLSLCFSAFSCGSTALTSDRCNQAGRPAPTPASWSSSPSSGSRTRAPTRCPA
eukprot:SAG22_NODE_1770_length_3614_cov_1.183784_3_plen_333_part_00